METPNFTITLVRHAETSGNSNKIVQSFTDTPLNEIGIDQANRLGKVLNDELFTVAYSSDLKRTQKTAECIFSQSNKEAPVLILDERLRERMLGVDLEGQDSTKWLQESIEWGIREKQSAICYNPPGAEVFTDVLKRAGEFFQEIIERHGSSGNHVLIVSHGLLLMTLVHHILNERAKYKVDVLIQDASTMLRTVLKNSAVSKIRVQVNPIAPDAKRQIQIVKYNDYSHLATE